jgi:uncharacterized protein YoxC
MFDDFRVAVAGVGEAVLDLARAVKDLVGYLKQSGRAVERPSDVVAIRVASRFALRAVGEATRRPSGA